MSKPAKIGEVEGNSSPHSYPINESGYILPSAKVFVHLTKNFNSDLILTDFIKLYVTNRFYKALNNYFFYTFITVV